MSDVRRLHARHRTELVYDGHARESVNEARLVPRSHLRQTVERSSLAVDPGTDVAAHVDAFGNEVRWFQVVDGHERLVIEAEAVVRTQGRPRIEPSLSPAEEWAALDADAYRDPLAEFLMRSPYVDWGEAVAALVESLHVPREGPMWDWLHELARTVHGAVEYERGATEVDTPVEAVARLRRGVCQDLAHLAIALCRIQGMAARYVSGWLFEPEHRGPGESHAWVEAHVPGTGWVEIDPTHPDPALDRYVRLAMGRDYSDVPPVRGNYLGAPAVSMEVTVEIDDLGASGLVA
jgi:transglutaminase-like putative cysteine protease